MTFIDNSISIATYDLFGNRTFYSLPVFDSYPNDMNYVCSYQKFTIATCEDRILITLAHTRQDGYTTEEVVDLTDICVNNFPIKLCIVKSNGKCELVAYQDCIHHGIFKLPDSFIE